METPPYKKNYSRTQDIGSFRTEIRPLGVKSLEAREFLKPREFKGPLPPVPPVSDFFEMPKKRRRRAGIVSQFSALALLSFLFLNPVASVYADTEISDDTVEDMETATSTEAALLPEVKEATSTTQMVPSFATSTATTSEEGIVSESALENPPPASNGDGTTVVIVPLGTTDATSTKASSTGAVLGDTTSSSTPPVVATTTPPTEDPNASTTPEVEDGTIKPPSPPPFVPTPLPVGGSTPTLPPPSSTPVPSSEATTTGTTTPTSDDTLLEPPKTVGEPVSVSFNPQNKYIFGDSECSLLQGGGYYCTHATTTSASSAESSAPTVFSANTAEGKEIFLRDTKGTRQITHNNFDDDAPAYDPSSGFVVWHASVNDRFQIMMANSDGERARQLTATPYNNTNPRISGKSITWQAWVNDSWEIFTIEDITAPNLSQKQITYNTANDMFPEINNRFITWESQEVGVSNVYLYDRVTGATSKVEKTDNGTYENPRFVLVFDSRKDNGDVETIGFDTATGKRVPFGNRPAGSGSDIPTPVTDEQGKAVPAPPGTSILKLPKNLERDGEDGDGGDLVSG